MNDSGFLTKLKVASPCPARWADMEGDERVRFCRSCRKRVYNFCGVQPAQAAAIIRETEGGLCGRFYQRADGTLLAGDCPVGAGHVWVSARRLTAAAALMVCCIVIAISTRAGQGSTSQARNRLYLAWDDAKWTVKGWLGIRRPVIMGDICVPAPLLSPSTNSIPAIR